MNRRGFIRGTIAGLLGCSMPAGLLGAEGTRSFTGRLFVGEPVRVAFTGVDWSAERMTEEGRMERYPTAQDWARYALRVAVIMHEGRFGRTP